MSIDGRLIKWRRGEAARFLDALASGADYDPPGYIHALHFDLLPTALRASAA